MWQKNRLFARIFLLMGDTKLVSPSNKEDNFKSICVSLLSAYSKGGMGIFQCEMLGGILVVFFFFFLKQ